MTRRLAALLGLVSLLAAAAPAPARLLIARSVTVGQFGEGPEDFRYPVGLVLLENGNFFVSDWKANRVGLYSPSGKMLRLLYPEGPGFSGPLGMVRDGEGNLYVVENRGHRVRVFDPAGTQVDRFGSRGEELGEFRYPRGIAMDRAGRLYVADYGNRRVQILDAEGNGLGAVTWTPPGAEEPARPRGVGVDPRGRLWATYTNQDRVVRFASDGTPDLVFGSSGSAKGQLDEPRYPAFDVRGNVYISDYENHRVQKFDPEGRFLYSFGARGSAPGQFHNPEYVALDTRGDIFVADTVNYRVQILELNGIDARKNLGYAAYEAGEWEEALEHYQRVLDREPGDREALARVTALFTRFAKEAREQGNIERALALHQDLLARIPGHLPSQRALRELFWERSRPLIHALAIGAGVLVSGALLLTLLFRAVYDELFPPQEEGVEEEPEDVDPGRPEAAPLRDYATRPRLRDGPEPPGEDREPASP